MSEFAQRHSLYAHRVPFWIGCNNCVKRSPTQMKLKRVFRPAKTALATFRPFRFGRNYTHMEEDIVVGHPMLKALIRGTMTGLCGCCGPCSLEDGNGGAEGGEGGKWGNVHTIHSISNLRRRCTQNLCENRVMCVCVRI